MLWPKTDQTDRDVQRCAGEVSYKIGGKNKKRFSSRPTAQAQSQEEAVRYKAAIANAVAPEKPGGRAGVQTAQVQKGL